MFTMSQRKLRKPRLGRRQYLITCTQADMHKYPVKDDFGNMLQTELNAGKGQVKVLHWTHLKEAREENGFRYHLA